MTDDELRAKRDRNLRRGELWIATLHVKCANCGYDWHKHPMTCTSYSALDAGRCAVQHEYFYRGSQTIEGQSIYEYECNLCSLPPRFSNVEPDSQPHPWCAEGRHFWHDPCYCGCQGNQMFCRCGAKKPYAFVSPRLTWESRL